MDFYMVPDHYLLAHGAIAGKDAGFFVDTGLVTADAHGRQPGLPPTGPRCTGNQERRKGP